MTETHKFEIGEKVLWESKGGILEGVVLAHSKRLKSPMCYVKFKSGFRTWITETSLESDKEVVVFT